jgi:Protein of unknown function (DUF3071)
MRELRFVGPGEDGDHVIVETADGEEAFSLPIDQDLRSAVRGEPVAPREVRSGQPPVTPREIQVRVRAGEDPQDIADEAGMPLARVLVFARQVLEERARITDEARRARARRNTADGQLVEFGGAVDARFAAHQVAPGDVRWDASRSPDGQWVVSAAWGGADADRIARWSFALASRTLTPLDETAADLLSDRPIRPIVHAVPDLRAASGPIGAGYSGAGGLGPAGSGGASPDATTGPLPRPYGGSSANDDQRTEAPEPRPAAGQDEAAPPLPLHLADPGRPPAPGAPPRRARAARGGRNPAVPAVPSAPAGPPAPAGGSSEVAGVASGPAAGRRSAPSSGATDEPTAEPGKPGKPKVPSWDDILLGVRRKRD